MTRLEFLRDTCLIGMVFLLAAFGYVAGPHWGWGYL